jgi:hypothetical protein
MLRGTVVILAAAGRSSGVTTAITYEFRGAISMCEKSARTRSNPRASQTFGINGTRMTAIWAGMWVKAIVSIIPILSANHAEARIEKADTRLVQKKMRPVVAIERSNLSYRYSASSA